MVLLDPSSDIPSLETLTRSVDATDSLYESLHRAGFVSVVPLIFLARREMIGTRGIGLEWADTIGMMLSDASIAQRRFGEPLKEFVDRAVGGAGNMSVAALDVEFTQLGGGGGFLMARHSPLVIVRELLADNPAMAFLQLYGMNPAELKAIARRGITHGPVLLDNIRQLQRRFNFLVTAAGYRVEDMNGLSDDDLSWFRPQ